MSHNSRTFCTMAESNIRRILTNPNFEKKTIEKREKGMCFFVILKYNANNSRLLSIVLQIIHMVIMSFMLIYSIFA